MLSRIGLWALSLGSVAWCVVALLGRSPSAWLAGMALLALAGYATLGVLFPQWQMYGYVLYRGQGGKKRVALTFDDGPDPHSTRRVLRILSEHHVRASFFVLGHKVLEHPEVVREIHAQGHLLALHGFHHERLFSFRSPDYVAREVRRSQDAIESICGVRPQLFRPPIGFVSHRTLAGAKRAGVQIVAWSTRTLDGIQSRSAEQIRARIARHLEDGAILLLHDAAEDSNFVPASVEALPQILALLAERGLHAVRVDEFAAEAALD